MMAKVSKFGEDLYIAATTALSTEFEVGLRLLSKGSKDILLVVVRCY